MNVLRLFSHLALATVFALFCVGCDRPGEPISDLEQMRLNLEVDAGSNVIVISFDALRADALGVYGYHLETSPEIDAFANRSLVFESAYTVAPVTPTSFAAAFTGLLPHRVFHDWDLVYADTLAQRFSDNGYRTGAFLNNVQLTRERNFDRGFEQYSYRFESEEAVIEQSLAWLREHRDEKIFAWIHFISPHSPYDYRELAKSLYDENYEGRFLRTTGGNFDTDDPVEIARIRSLYDGEILYADLLFRQLMSGLEENGLTENSVIVVTSDHGEEFKEHGGFQHDRLTEEHVRIPLIISHPSLETPQRSKTLASNVDLFPTLLSMVGIDHDSTVDGRDLTRITEGPTRLAGVSMLGAKKRWLSMRRGSEKLIQMCMPEDTRQLYDLSADPGETRNLAQNELELADGLFSELGEVLGGEPCPVMQAAMRGKGPEAGLSDENIEALKALGYLQD